MRLVYLEAGSGADSPVPAKMIYTVKKALGDALLVVGGGIRSAEAAADAAKAGADLIVTGTAVERCEDVSRFVSDVTAAVHRPQSVP
jgi:phosphoglycerol geranylgeranyltransferase